MKRLFGTDGIRGVANVPPMTPEFAVALGRAAASVVQARDAGGRPCVVIGRDTRLSGPMLEGALAAGLNAGGVDVISAGVVPTPAVAFLVREHEAAMGVVISASHNPFADNGIKFFGPDGRKLTDAEEDAMQALVEAPLASSAPVTGQAVGRVCIDAEASATYAAFCVASAGDSRLDGMRVVFDCANGATSEVVKGIFTALGVEASILHADPDGQNINAGCGSQFTSDLRREVVAQGAAAGLAFDGDGDRLIAVDEAGAELTGDHLLAILARRYKDEGRLASNLVVATVMSNFGLRKCLRELGVDLASSAVGDRYVMELLEERDADLGGEASGHIILRDVHSTGDGILAAIQVLMALKAYGAALSELAAGMQSSPQCMRNLEVGHKPDLAGMPAIGEAIAAAESELGADGRVLVRYSGTQPMCRVMVEGPTQAMTERLCDAISAVVVAELR